MEEITNDQAMCFRFVLKRLLDKKEMRQSDLANAVGLPQSTFHDWVNGRSPRDLSFVKKISQFFNVTFEYMIFGTKTDQEKMAAYVRKLEFENAMLKLEQNKQLNIFESKEEAIARIQKLMDEINEDFPELEEDIAL